MFTGPTCWVFFCTYLKLWHCFIGIRKYLSTVINNDCTNFERDHFGHTNSRYQFQKRSTCNVSENLDGCWCQTCGRILFSKAVYVNHRWPHEIRSEALRFSFQKQKMWLAQCLLKFSFLTVFWSKKHPVVHKHHISQADPGNQVEKASPIRNIYLKL